MTGKRSSYGNLPIGDPHRCPAPSGGAGAATVPPPWKSFQGVGAGCRVCPNRRLRRHRPPAAGPARDALLRAAVEVAAERGAAGVTHRAVTERVGVPLATASYFFSSIDDLVAEALRTFVADEAQRLPTSRPTSAATSTPLTRWRPRWPRPPCPSGPLPWALAQFETYLQAARGDALRAPVADALAVYEQVAEAALEAAGARRRRRRRRRRSTPWPTASPCTTSPGPGRATSTPCAGRCACCSSACWSSTASSTGRRRWPTTLLASLSRRHGADRRKNLVGRDHDGVWAITCDPGIDDAVALAVAAGEPEPRGWRRSWPASGNVPAGTAWRNTVGLAALLGLACRSASAARGVARRHPDHARALVPRRRRARRAGHAPAGAPGRPARRGPARPRRRRRHRPADRGRPGAAVRAGARRRSVWMGGSVACARGVDPIGSEFNAAADRRAVDEVLGSGVPVRVIPIEVTVQVPFGDDDIAPWRTGPPIARLCADLVERRRGGSGRPGAAARPRHHRRRGGARPVRLGGAHAPLPPRRLARGGSSRNRSGLGRRRRGPRQGARPGS